MSNLIASFPSIHVHAPRAVSVVGAVVIAASLPFIRMGFLDEEGSHLPPAPLRESKAAPKDTADDIIVPIDEVEDGLDHEHVNDGFLRQFMKQADQCRSPAEYSDEECSPSTTSAEPAGPRVIFVLLNWRTIHAALVRMIGEICVCLSIGTLALHARVYLDVSRHFAQAPSTRN